MAGTAFAPRRILATISAVSCAIALGVPAAAQANVAAERSGPRCEPGAPGLGDTYYPTYGNGGYDVRDYDLDVTYDPATDVLDGRAAIKAKATQSLCSFNLDLVGMTVREVEIDGSPAQWTRSGQELVITPKHPLHAAAASRCRSATTGFRTSSSSCCRLRAPTGFMATPDGATVAGQPEVAAGWFPVNDHPLDKAAYSFDVTVPTGYEVVANGFLKDTDTRGGMTTYEWDAREPMASYLATIDIGQWDVDTWRTESGLPVYDAVDSAITGGLREVIDSSLSRQGEILDVLAERFGPYPFSTVGAIVDNQDDLFFALETQTRPVYSKYFWFDGEGNPTNGDFVVVHELAHQWFGDDVALARWQDIWLNEGFATYAEWLWAEHEGVATPQETFQATYDAIPADDPFWDLVIGDPGVDAALRQPGLRPRCDDLAGAAKRDRRRRVLADPAAVGGEPEQRERHHAGVHRSRGADLGTAARRTVRHVAVHRREASGAIVRDGAGAATGVCAGAGVRRAVDGDAGRSVGAWPILSRQQVSCRWAA